MQQDRTKDFSYSHYRSILREIKRTHDVVSFRQAAAPDAAMPSRSFLILRHDVEFSLSAAAAMAEIDAAEGVVSTFFLLLTGDYNCFEEESAAYIRAILSCGHMLGLHYDGGLLHRLGVEADAVVRGQIDLLQTFFGTEIEAISAHMPMRSGAVLRLPGVLNVYDPYFFEDMKYVSDSLQAWRDGVVTSLLARFDRIHLLIHECNWSDDGRGWERLMQDEAEATFQALRVRMTHRIEMFREGLRSRVVRDALFRDQIRGARTVVGRPSPASPVVRDGADA